ncbi:hypothetical protein B5M42_008840 [Paenibacillus athensensis]|uniref:Transposase n=2 Tax=Paenibacillus athensensis TaxID=1967502 RepID=A0A4Y8QAK9_9BACL|nr:hypothetical protein [Paenibacillus athensensis]
MTTLEFLSQDVEARRQYEMRQKALHDEASMLAGAREEGEHNKAKEIALKLLNKGMDVAMTAEVSGLSVEEVNQLRHTLN